MAPMPSFYGNRQSHFANPYSLDIWDQFDYIPPSKPLANEPRLSGEASVPANVRIDWKETLEAHIIKAELPRLKKGEVKVEVLDARVIRISGERNREQEERIDKWHRSERGVGRFFRWFRLPKNAITNEGKAKMENGVLIIVVFKEKVNKG